MNRRDGFSLLELLIYMALVAVIMVGIIEIFTAVNSGRGRNEVQSEVDSNLRFAVGEIESDLRAATSIATPTTGSGSAAPPALVQARKNSQIGPVVGVAVSSTAAGNAMVVAVTIGQGGVSVTGVADNKGDTFVSAGVSGSNGLSGVTEIWYATSTSAGATNVTTTLSNSGSWYSDPWVYEVSGLNASAMLDATGTVNVTVASTTIAGPSLTTASSSEFLVSINTLQNNITGLKAGSAWTDDGIQNGDDSAHLITSQATTTAAVWNGDVAGQYEVSGATFRAAPGGGGATSNTLTLTTASGTISYCVVSSTLRRQTGGAACNTSSDAITDSTVLVTTSTFSRFQNTNAILGKTAVSIQIDLALTYNGTGPDEQYSEEKITTTALRNF